MPDEWPEGEKLPCWVGKATWIRVYDGTMTSTIEAQSGKHSDLSPEEFPNTKTVIFY